MTTIPTTWTRARRADSPAFYRYRDRLAAEGLTVGSAVLIRRSPALLVGRSQVEVRTLAGEDVGTYGDTGWQLFPEPATPTTDRVLDHLRRNVTDHRENATELRDQAARLRASADDADARAALHDADADAYEALLAAATSTTPATPTVGDVVPFADLRPGHVFRLVYPSGHKALSTYRIGRDGSVSYVKDADDLDGEPRGESVDAFRRHPNSAVVARIDRAEIVSIVP